MSLDFALNPFKKGKKTEVENIRKVEVNDSPLTKAINGYYEYGYKNRDDSKPVLSPSDLQNYLNYFKHNKEKTNRNFGAYFSKLVMQSFISGYNDFVFDIEDHFSDKFCLPVIRNDKGYLPITFNGNPGSRSGSNSKGLMLKINGFADDHFGFNSENCYFTINGDMDAFCCNGMENCEVILEGNVDEAFGFGSRNCTYKTHSKKTFELLRPKVNETSIVQLLGKHDNILEAYRK